MENKNIFALCDAINKSVGDGKKRMTLAMTSDYGTPFVIYVNMVEAKITKYAQYNENLHLRFVPKRHRCDTISDIHGARCIAVFSGWSESNWTPPKSYIGFDKNLFYELTDSFDQDKKIGEESERMHISEIDSRGKVYQIVTMGGAQLFEDVKQLYNAFEISGLHSNPVTRRELQGTPIIKGFCGPMYNGIDNQNRSVIRYESAKAYEMYSR